MMPDALSGKDLEPAVEVGRLLGVNQVAKVLRQQTLHSQIIMTLKQRREKTHVESERRGPLLGSPVVVEEANLEKNQSNLIFHRK